MKRIVLGGVGLAIAVVLVVYVALLVPPVADSVAVRGIEKRLVDQKTELFEPNALRVFFCGTSSPIPHPTRAQACVAVFAANRFWVVDTGPRSWNTIALLGIDASRIGGVFLTHFHSDHIGALGEHNMQTWAAGRAEPLRVYGPPGVERIVRGFDAAYALDRDYRIAHHGESLMPPEASTMEPIVVDEPRYGEGPTTVLEVDGLRVTAFPVRHLPVRPAYGYRFDYLGRSVVVSGDTARAPALVEAAREVDVLVHEAHAVHLTRAIAEVADEVGRPRIARILRDVESYHTPTEEVARIAEEAGARFLVLTHLVPPPAGVLAERIFVRGIDDARSDGWVLADDGLMVTLPRGSDEIRLERP
jgi:ribonuclease Z